MPYPYYGQYVGQGFSLPPLRPPVAPYNPILYYRNPYYRPGAYKYYRPPTYNTNYWRSPQYTNYMNQGRPKPTVTATPKPTIQQPAQYVGQGTYIGPQGPVTGTWGPRVPTWQELHAVHVADTPENRAKLARLPTQEEIWQERAALYQRNNPLPTGYAAPPTPEPAPVAPASYGGGYGYGGYGGGGGGKSKTPYYQTQPKQSYYRGSPIPMSPDVATWLAQMVTWGMEY